MNQSPWLQGLHKKVRDVLDDAPSASPAYVSTEIRLKYVERLLEDPQAQNLGSVCVHVLYTCKPISKPISIKIYIVYVYICDM